jgi:hypothetical protein
MKFFKSSNQKINPRYARLLIGLLGFLSSGAASASVRLKKSKWKVGAEIPVYFMNGDAGARAKVEHFAREWERYGNFSFKFYPEKFTGNQMAIVVAFEKQEGKVAGNASVGRGTNLTGAPSLSLAHNAGPGTILHEFGHALGLFDEIQHPDLGKLWIPEKAVPHLVQFYGLPEEVAKDWIHPAPWDKWRARAPYDRYSIMMYKFPNYVFRDNQPSGRANYLSRGDVDAIRALYPGKRIKFPGQHTYLYRFAGEKTLRTYVAGGILKVHFNGKLIAAVDGRKARGQAYMENISITEYLTGKRDRIEFLFEPTADKYQWSGIAFETLKTDQIAYGEIGCYSGADCTRITASGQNKYYIARFEQSNRGQPGYFEEDR